MKHDKFDKLTRQLATSTSRRQALRTLGGAMLAGILSPILGDRAAWGQQTCNSTNCPGGTCCNNLCCSGSCCYNGLLNQSFCCDGANSSCCNGSCCSGACCGGVCVN